MTPKMPYDPELLAMQLAGAEWFNNSDPNGGSCVDVAFLPDGMTALRDSTQTGVALAFDSAEWDTFVAGAKAGLFDRPQPA